MYAVEVASIHGWDLISLGRSGILYRYRSGNLSSTSASHFFLPYLSADYVLVYTHFDILVITLPTNPAASSRLRAPPPRPTVLVAGVAGANAAFTDARNFSNGHPLFPTLSIETRPIPLTDKNVRNAVIDRPTEIPASR